LVVRVGFVGSGGIAEKHANQLLRIEKAKLVAFSDLIFPRAQNLAKKADAKAYSDPEEMMRKEDLDAVYLCTPPFVRDIAISIAERGLHVFIEKPVALTVELAKTIERALIKSNVITAVGYQFRYFDTTDLAKQLLEKNGPIGLVEGHDHFPLRISEHSQVGDFFTVSPEHWILRKEKSGEHIVESSTHVFDLARFLVGEVSKVYAEMDTLILGDIPGFDKADSSAVILRFKNGAIGAITNTLATRKSDLSTSLKITAGKITVEHGCHSGMLRIFEDTKVTEVKATTDSFFEEDRTFVEAVVKGDARSIRCSYSEGIKTLQLTLAAVEAAQKKKPVVLQ
jgi:myo-inositol 2-dehydrogenase / D-chiro-inositol 1-dehydrogenase